MARTAANAARPNATVQAAARPRPRRHHRDRRRRRLKLTGRSARRERRSISIVNRPRNRAYLEEAFFLLVETAFAFPVGGQLRVGADVAAAGRASSRHVARTSRSVLMLTRLVPWINRARPPPIRSTRTAWRRRPARVRRYTVWLWSGCSSSMATRSSTGHRRSLPRARAVSERPRPAGRIMRRTARRLPVDRRRSAGGAARRG